LFFFHYKKYLIVRFKFIDPSVSDPASVKTAGIITIALNALTLGRLEISAGFNWFTVGIIRDYFADS